MIDSRVKHLRTNATPVEDLLWHQLRRKRVNGVRFRRQFKLGTYIVDFVCLPARLVIEVDGATHELTHEQDERRTKWLEGQGFQVLRFRNLDVAKNLDGVVRAIEAATKNPSP